MGCSTARACVSGARACGQLPTTNGRVSRVATLGAEAGDLDVIVACMGLITVSATANSQVFATDTVQLSATDSVQLSATNSVQVSATDTVRLSAIANIQVFATANIQVSATGGARQHSRGTHQRHCIRLVGVSLLPARLRRLLLHGEEQVRRLQGCAGSAVLGGSKVGFDRGAGQRDARQCLRMSWALPVIQREDHPL